MRYGSAMTGTARARARSSAVERPTHNRQVTGSIPVGPTSELRCAGGGPAAPAVALCPPPAVATRLSLESGDFSALNLGGGGGGVNSAVRDLAGAIAVAPVAVAGAIAAVSVEDWPP